MCWENTLEALELERGTGGPNMVKEMDLDALCRTGKKLHDLDLEDKQRLLKALFVCMRCGLLEEGQNLCVRVGQEWRSLRSRDGGFTMILTMRVVQLQRGSIICLWRATSTGKFL